MSSLLRVLFIEDSEDDAALLDRALRQGGYELVSKRVDTPEALTATLDDGAWDLVLADYSMPRFSAPAAIELIRGRGLDVPVIIISGAVGEEAVVSALRSGAQDFFVKGRLALLLPAVERELREAKGRRARSRAEAELRDTETRFRLMVEGSEEVFFYEHDPEHRFTYVSPSVESVLGYTAAELLGRRYDELLTEAQANILVHQRTETAIVSGQILGSYDAHVRHRDGRTLVLEICERPMVQDGDPAGIQGFARDITERRRAAEALRRSEERLRHVTATSPVVLYVLALDTDDAVRPTWVSSNIERILGYTVDDTLAPDWFKAHVHPEDRDAALIPMRVLLAAGSHTREFRFRRSDGSYRWVRDELRLLRGADGQPSEIVGSWLDETQVRELKEKFHRAQKMEAVGRLAGGIAHDFNNVLSAVTGYAHLLLDQLEAADPRWHEANEIAEAGRRGAELVRHLMAFSRKQVIQPEIISIDAVVANMENMLRRLIGADVQLALRPGPAPGRVRADRGQLEQVLMNLVVNARDAMPEGGRITIASRDAELTEEDVRRYDYVLPGKYVLLEVADTGHGMSEDTQSRIFDPFFTTKEEGKGTGLGLASVYGIVKQSGGYIWVASRPGEGTTFSIYLPLVDAAEPADATPASTPLSDASPGVPAVVLLVEDQPSVRALVRRVLEARGHRVLEAAGGPEALQLAAAHAGPIDLLLTDVVMPQMNGIELAQRLTAVRTGLCVLFMSGYVEEEIASRAKLDPRMHLIEKPFEPVALARRVHEVLDAALHT